MLRFARGGHCTDECLVSLLDGELPARKRRAAERHLRSCWDCRTRMAGFEAQIHTLSRAMQDRGFPPPDWTGRAKRAFQERAVVIRAVAEDERQAARQRRIARWCPAPATAAALAACLLLLAIAVHSLRNPRRAEAGEVLRKSAASDRRAEWLGRGNTVRQRLQVSRKSRRSGQETTALRECWWGDGRPVPAAATDQSPVLEELRDVYRANGLDWDVPLAAANVAHWRDGLRGAEDSIARGANLVLTVTERSPRGSGGNRLESVRLVLRPPDLHPIEQELVTNGARFVISEVAYGIVERPALASAPALPATRTAMPEDREITGAPARPAATLADEIGVEFALHEAGLCLSGTVTVERLADGGLAVRGMVDTDARRTQLRRTLGGLPAVHRIELRTMDEAAAETAAVRGAEPSGTRAPIELRSNTFAVEPRLHAHFLRTESRESAREHTHELIDGTLGSAGNLIPETAALARLAKAYPAARVATLPAAAQAMLAGMIAGHRQRAGQKLAQVQVSLTALAAALEVALEVEAPSLAPPLAAPADSPGDWGQECHALAEAAARLESRIWELLDAGPGSAGRTVEAARAVAVSLYANDMHLRRLTAAVQTQFARASGREDGAPDQPRSVHLLGRGGQ